MKIESKLSKFDPITIIIETEEEALTLAAVVANVGGLPEGPRGIVDKIYQYLQSVGIVSDKHELGIITLPDTYEELR